jgi:integrase
MVMGGKDPKDGSRIPLGGDAFKYWARGKWKYGFDVSQSTPAEGEHRPRKQGIPTREQAEAMAAKARAEIFERGFLKREKPNTLLTSELLDAYMKVAKQQVISWQSDRGRVAHLKRWLGSCRIMNLTLRHIDEYRDNRRGELTKRKKPPAPASLDREVELLKRACNYGLDRKLLSENPLKAVKLLRVPNVRTNTVREDAIIDVVAILGEVKGAEKLLEHDTGMRKEEVQGLELREVDLQDRMIRLPPERTKTKEPKNVYLNERCYEALRKLVEAAPPGAVHVFINPKTGRRYVDTRKSFKTACRKAGIEGTWVHDLRRTFATNARRAGVPESVVMKMTGHKTRAVFDRYNIVSDDDVKAGMKLLEEKTKSGFVKVSSKKPERGEDKK